MSKPIVDNEFSIYSPNLKSAMRYFEDASVSPEARTVTGFDAVDPIPSLVGAESTPESPSKIRKFGNFILSKFDGMEFGIWR